MSEKLVSIKECERRLRVLNEIGNQKKRDDKYWEKSDSLEENIFFNESDLKYIKENR